MGKQKSSGPNPSEGAKAAKKKVGKSREPQTSAKSVAKKLSPRQSKLLDGVLAGKSTRAAAIDAGYSENTADDHAKRLLNTRAMREALAEKLIGIEEIAQGLNAGVEALQTDTFCNVIGSKLKGTEEVKLTHVDKIAWTERRKYLELICRLKGLDPGLKIEHDGEIDHHLIVEHVHLGSR
jgi:DNA-binding CsgD family transcriptional regulator